MPGLGNERRRGSFSTAIARLKLRVSIVSYIRLFRDDRAGLRLPIAGVFARVVVACPTPKEPCHE